MPLAGFLRQYEIYYFPVKKGFLEGLYQRSLLYLDGFVELDDNRILLSTERRLIDLLLEISDTILERNYINARLRVRIDFQADQK